MSSQRTGTELALVREVIAGDGANALKTAIPVAALRHALNGMLDCVELAGRLLTDVADPEFQHDADERRWLKAQLLAALPVSAEAGDADDVTAELLSVIPGDTCAVVTRWLSTARGQARFTGTGAAPTRVRA